MRLLTLALVLLIGVGGLVWLLSKRDSGVDVAGSSRRGAPTNPALSEPVAAPALVELASVPREPSVPPDAPAAEAAHAPAPASPSSEAVADGPEVWARQYASMDRAALLAESDAIGRWLVEQTQEEFAHRFDAGWVEHMGDGKVLRGSDVDDTKIMQVRIKSTGGMDKVVLPEAEFPALYAVKRKQVWLNAEAQRRALGQSTGPADR